MTVADDLQLFKSLGRRIDQPKTATELASCSDVDPTLLIRLLRHLTAKGVITELPGNGSYQATELSKTLASPEGSSGIQHVAKVYTPLFHHVPQFLKSIGYKVPKDNRKGPLQEVLAKPGKCCHIIERAIKTIGVSCNPKLSTYCILQP